MPSATQSAGKADGMVMLVVDLDRPARGPICVQVQALIDAAQGIPP
jgi:hypothetical protein